MNRIKKFIAWGVIGVFVAAILAFLSYVLGEDWWMLPFAITAVGALILAGVEVSND